MAGSRPQFIPSPQAWPGKAYVGGYIARIRSIRDCFAHQAPGPIERPVGFDVTKAHYFHEYQMLHSYGGFEWHTVFSHIKHKP